MKKFIRYLAARLNERSTLTGVVAAIGSGAIIPAPYSFAMIAIGIVTVLLPTTTPAAPPVEHV